MLRKVALCFALAGLLVASAKSYTVKIFEPALAGATEVKPGEYTVEVNGEKAVLRSGKVEVSSSIKVESCDTKYNSTTVRYANADGKMRIQEIHLGGTKTKLVFTM